MKKVVFFLIGFLLLGFAIAFSVNCNTKCTMSYNMFEFFNVEALSNGESNDIICIGLGTIDCPRSKTKVIYTSL